MELIRVAKYFNDISNIPVAVYQESELLQEFCVLHFKPNISRHFVKPILDDNINRNMDSTITESFLLCGYVRDRKSGLVMVVGPVMEFPCMRKTAYNILNSMGEPYNRVDEMVHYFQKIPTMPLTTFTKNLCFLNYIINEEVYSDDFIDHRLEILLGEEKDKEEHDSPITHNPREWDRKLEACIEYGKVEELEKFMKTLSVEGKMGIAAMDSIRSFKNVAISSIALIARAAHRGGMEYEAALTRSDEYAKEIETLRSFEEINNCLNQAFFEYATIVAKLRSLKTDSKIVKRVINYVLEHLYESIKIGDMADAMENNVSYLCRFFKKETGKTLTEYINEEKIEEAKQMLMSTERSIVDIAMTLGYSSQAYFTTLFGKYVDMTPMEYRASRR